MFFHNIVSSGKNDDLGKLLLRLMLGIILIFHGIHKIFNGIDEISGLITGNGLPYFLSFGVYIGEVVAPVMIILGIKTRFAALLVLINMLFAWILVDFKNTLLLNEQGGMMIEGILFYAFTALALIILGPGRYSLSDGRQ